MNNNKIVIELTKLELSIIITAMGYAQGNIDTDEVEPLKRRLIEIYKEENNARYMRSVWRDSARG